MAGHGWVFLPFCSATKKRYYRRERQARNDTRFVFVLLDCLAETSSSAVNHLDCEDAASPLDSVPSFTIQPVRRKSGTSREWYANSF